MIFHTYRSHGADIVADTYRLKSTRDPDVILALRERRPGGRTSPQPTPLLLVHGATIASVLWDNPLTGWSWMDRLAADGFHVFALDLRGYGRSSRPACFADPLQPAAPYATAAECVGDVLDAMDFIRRFTARDRIDLLGGSWGSVICGKLAAERPDAGIRRLVLYAPLYSEPDARPVWLASGDTTDGSLIGAYRDVLVSDLKARWDAEIPVCDKASWRPDGVFEALADSCLAEDTCHPWASRESFRVPAGTIADLAAIFRGRPHYACQDVTVPSLLLRGNADPVSTHADASRLFETLGATAKQYTIVGNAAHFMVGERALPQVHRLVAGFLQDDFAVG